MNTLSELAALYAAAKSAEIDAIDNRRRIAAQIQSLTGHNTENQKTYDDEGWKVIVKAPLITTVDWTKWEQIQLSIPVHLWPVVMKPSLDIEGLKWLKDHDTTTYNLVAQCITVKPGAVVVNVKAVEVETA